MAAAAPDPRRWKALALLCTAFFMVVLDVAIVNVALPKIGESMKVNSDSAAWVLIAYTLTYGGFLLLGGRAADLLGRRRMFSVGVVVFTLASLACALSTTQAMLVSARTIQGLGAAIVTPAALSIVSTTFAEGAERNKALGIWGAVGGSGAAVGVLAGGLLVGPFGWASIFYINVPVGIAVLLLTRRLVDESHADAGHRQYDPLGALTVTGSLVALVYAISRAPAHGVGWASTQTIGLLVLSALLMAAFIVIESRVQHPLAPLGFFRIRTVAGANIVGLLLGGCLFGSFFMLTFYMQSVLAYSARQAGIAFLATAGTAVVAAGVSQALVTKIGPRIVMSVGLALVAVGQLWYTQIPVTGHYFWDLFPGFVATGVGLAFGFVPISIVGLAGISSSDAGLASGLINTTQQIGGALGTAIVVTASTTRVNHLVAEHASPAVAITGGAHWAFWSGALIAVLGTVAAFTLVRGRDLEPAAEPVPTPA
jgi:EmrB/QacA subfamily drug resistance transporter